MFLMDLQGPAARLIVRAENVITGLTGVAVPRRL